MLVWSSAFQSCLCFCPSCFLWLSLLFKENIDKLISYDTLSLLACKFDKFFCDSIKHSRLVEVFLPLSLHIKWLGVVTTLVARDSDWINPKDSGCERKLVHMTLVWIPSPIYSNSNSFRHSVFRIMRILSSFSILEMSWPSTTSGRNSCQGFRPSSVSSYQVFISILGMIFKSL